MIGSFVLFSIILFMIAIVIFGGNTFFVKENLMISYFDGSLKGLSVGADVTYRGVSIGQVKEIKIHIRSNGNSNQKILVPVLISLNAGKTLIVDDTANSDDTDIQQFMQEMCAQGLRAKLKLKSLVTGKLYVDLAFYEESVAVFRDTEGTYFEIPTLPSEMQQISKMMESVNLDQLFNKFISTLDALEQLSTGLAETFDKEQTTTLMANLVASSDKLNTILAKIDSDLPPMLNTLDTALVQFSSFTAHADETVESLNRQIEPLSNDLSTTLVNIDQTLQEVNLLLSQAEKTIHPNSPLYKQFMTTLSQFETTAKTVQNLSKYIQRNPNTLIFGLQKSKK